MGRCSGVTTAFGVATTVVPRCASGRFRPRGCALEVLMMSIFVRLCAISAVVFPSQCSFDFGYGDRQRYGQASVRQTCPASSDPACSEHTGLHCRRRQCADAWGRGWAGGGQGQRQKGIEPQARKAPARPAQGRLPAQFAECVESGPRRRLRPQPISQALALVGRIAKPGLRPQGAGG